MRDYADLRDGAVSAIDRLTASGQDIIVIVVDSTSTSKIGPFLERYPERVINVGIAEQHGRHGDGPRARRAYRVHG